MLTPHQSAELRRALSGPIGILGGGPGTGKTFTVAELILMLSQSIGEDQIVVGAPTGKARVRVAEVLHAAGLRGVRTGTWHSILRGGPSGNFAYNQTNPLPYKVFIGDEESMTDTAMMAARYRALPRGALVLHVGDVYQLPPVGSGSPLRDFIAAGLPYGELTELQRQAATSMIALNCQAMRNGKPFVHIRIPEGQRLADVMTAERIDRGENQFHVEADSPERQMARLVEFLAVVRSLGMDPAWDCQGLVMRNGKGKGETAANPSVDRKSVNAILQRELNAGGEKSGGNPFAVGDKTINLKNNYFPLVEFDGSDADVSTDDQNRAYVANGEIGRVMHAEAGLSIIELSSPRRVVKVARGQQESSQEEGSGGGDSEDSSQDDKTNTGCSWDHAYGVTVWKAQGSDWPATVTLIDRSALRTGCRELIYTAGSRPKRLGVTIGEEWIMTQMCQRQAIWKRKTFLRERILMQKAKLEMAEL